MLVGIGRDRNGKRVVITHSTWWAPLAAMAVLGIMGLLIILISSTFNIDETNIMIFGTLLLIFGPILYYSVALVFMIAWLLFGLIALALNKAFGLTHKSFIFATIRIITSILHFLFSFMISPLEYFRRDNR